MFKSTPSSEACPIANCERKAWLEFDVEKFYVSWTNRKKGKGWVRHSYTVCQVISSHHKLQRWVWEMGGRSSGPQWPILLDSFQKLWRFFFPYKLCIQYSFEFPLLIRKSTFCQKVTVHKDRKSPSFAFKRDVLELATLRYGWVLGCQKEDRRRNRQSITIGTPGFEKLTTALMVKSQIYQKFNGESRNKLAPLCR